MFPSIGISLNSDNAKELLPPAKNVSARISFSRYDTLTSSPPNNANAFPGVDFERDVMQYYRPITRVTCGQVLYHEFAGCWPVSWRDLVLGNCRFLIDLNVMMNTLQAISCGFVRCRSQKINQAYIPSSSKPFNIRTHYKLVKTSVITNKKNPTMRISDEKVTATVKENPVKLASADECA